LSLRYRYGKTGATIEQLREELARFQTQISSVSPVTARRRFAVAFCLKRVRRASRSSSQNRRSACGNATSKTKKRKSEKTYRLTCRSEIVEADVAEEDRICPCCRDEMRSFGTGHQRAIWDLIPAELFVWGDRRSKRCLAAKCKKKIAQVRWSRTLAS